MTLHFKALDNEAIRAKYNPNKATAQTQTHKVHNAALCNQTPSITCVCLFSHS